MSLEGVQLAAHAALGERDHQEDAFAFDLGLGLFAVADGMGAAASGRCAADLALSTICEQVRLPSSVTARERLVSAIRAANSAIFARSEAAARDWQEGARGGGHDWHWHGVGTTIVALLLASEAPDGTGGRGRLHAILAHVGDSRAYRLRSGKLEQLTVDHRLIDEGRRAGMSEAELAKLPAAIITQALGISAAPRVEVASVEVLPGDLFVLCSDGLSDSAPREEIERILVSSPNDLDAAARALVARAAALQSEACATGEASPLGSGDNVTVMLVRIAG